MKRFYTNVVKGNKSQSFKVKSIFLKSDWYHSLSCPQVHDNWQLTIAKRLISWDIITFSQVHDNWQGSWLHWSDEVRASERGRGEGGQGGRDGRLISEKKISSWFAISIISTWFTIQYPDLSMWLVWVDFIHVRVYIHTKFDIQWILSISIQINPHEFPFPRLCIEHVGNSSEGHRG